MQSVVAETEETGTWMTSLSSCASDHKFSQVRMPPFLCPLNKHSPDSVFGKLLNSSFSNALSNLITFCNNNNQKKGGNEKKDLFQNKRANTGTNSQCTLKTLHRQVQIMTYLLKTCSELILILGSQAEYARWSHCVALPLLFEWMFVTCSRTLMYSIVYNSLEVNKLTISMCQEWRTWSDSYSLVIYCTTHWLCAHHSHCRQAVSIARLCRCQHFHISSQESYQHNLIFREREHKSLSTVI